MSDERKIVGYDPMTGQPIYEELLQETIISTEKTEEMNEVENETSSEELVGYDPMTGQPIYKNSQETEQTPIGYDPMTGQPIYKNSQETERTPVGYDPMTGQPIYENSTAIAQAKTAKKKRKKPTAIPAIILAVLAIVILVVAGIKSGIFLSKGKKVAVATVNTFSETPELVKDLKPLFAVKSRTFSITGNFEMEGVSMEGTVSVDKTEANAFGSIKAEDIPETDFAARVTPDGIKVQSKAISDLTFVYNTADDKDDSYISRIVGEDSIESLDSALEAIGKTKQADAMEKDLAKLIIDEYGELEFEKASEDKFEINGKKVNCKGYTVEITEDNIMNIVEGMEDIIDDAYGDVLKDLDISAKDIIEELEDEVDGMEDLELTFYLYKNKLAAIIAEIDGEEFTMEFLGGDYRTQNVKFSMGRSVLMEVNGEKNGSVESMECSVWGSDVFEYEYDTKSGDLALDFDDGYVEMEANVRTKGDSVTISLEDLAMKNNRMISGLDFDDITCAFTFSNSSKKAKFSGDEFNVGTADEDEFMDLIDDLEDAVEDYEDLDNYF